MGAVNQLTQAGLGNAQLTANTLGGTSSTLGGLYTGAGNANAGAVAAGANATAGALSGIGNIPASYFANWGSGGSGYQQTPYVPGRTSGQQGPGSG